MHRRPLLDLLAGYRALYPEEGATVDRFERFVRADADCFERHCGPGHVTAAAWILSPECDRFLLTHHRKLDRWLQVGGHCDGEHEVHLVALREAHEETGIADFGMLATDQRLLPLDIDIHEIPAFGDEPPHLHYDVRFLLRAPTDQVVTSEESHALRWFPMAALAEACREESLLRMGAKARAIVGHL
jgi:8-oxo-dGTP pyrophosphatase MutT (NUDIX family)